MENPAIIGLIILLLPTVLFAVLALFHNLLPRHGDWLGTGGMFVAMILAFYLFIDTSTNRLHSDQPAPSLTCEWLKLDKAPDAEINGVADNGAVIIGIQIDNLTAIMLVVVTVVSFVVHLFSIGYMHGDAKYGRFFASLSMFTASMLGLVLSDNLLSLYMSWEVMGLASYILIGHFVHKPSANYASLKAFIVTRIGDVGMFLGILVIYWQVGSFRFDDLFAAVEEGVLSGNLRLLAALGLFFGAMGKSAQFPLHVWLPDAMEGPTPVSALIHAATMVAAGVYLVGRTYILFPVEALLVVAYVGAATAIMSATIAVVQTDIKKVLAYSTVSQLGYMMIGLGCYGYYAGLGHLTTHAFFKACLFLGSGSIIHAMHHHQEMDKYGGLWRKLPITFATFMIATLALTGFPYLFSGFHTKDTIIAKAIEFGMIAGGPHVILGYLATGAALLTSFYMFRLIFLTFFGKPKDQELYDHAREIWVILIPLIMLASLSLWYVGGPVSAVGDATKGNVLRSMLEMPEQKDHEIHEHIFRILAERQAAGDLDITHGEDHASRLIGLFAPNAMAVEDNHGEHVVAPAHGETDSHGAHAELVAAYEHIEHEGHARAVLGSWIVFPLGVIIAALFYFYHVFSAATVARRLRPVHVFLQNLWFIDHLYRYTVIRPFVLVCALHGAFDKYVIDGFVNMLALLTRIESWMTGIFDNFAIDGIYNGTAWTTRWAGRMASRVQTGRIHAYLLSILLGAVALIVIFVFVRG